MSNVFEFRYKAAIALNNMGVTLLERQQHAESIAAFRDAVHVLRDVHQRESGLSTSEIQTILQRACHDVSVSSISKVSVQWTNQNPQLSTSPEIHPRSISEDGIEDAIRQTFETKENQTPLLALAIRLEPSTSYSHNNYWNGPEIAILLYNFGLAYSCMASVTSDAPDSIEFKEGAHKLFHLSITNVQSLSAHLDEATEQPLGEHLLFLSIMILCGLEHSASVLGNEADALNYHHVIEILVEDLKDIDDNDVLHSRCSSTAPAA